jgi:translation initiation factor 6 (eIF-6)
MVVYKNKILLNPNFEESAIKFLEDNGFETKKSKISGIETVGANLVMFEGKGFISENAKDEEINEISEFFNAEMILGTVNNKSPIVKAGFAKNIHGIIVSTEMSGAEMMALEELMKNE